MNQVSKIVASPACPAEGPIRLVVRQLGRLGLAFALLCAISAPAFGLQDSESNEAEKGTNQQETVSPVVETTESKSATNPISLDWPIPEGAEIVFESRFDEPLPENDWRLFGGSWQQMELDEIRFLSQFQKQSYYEPPHRSPRHLALRTTQVDGSFSMVIRARSTHQDYNHRDVCFYFGYQDDAHFYYVHLAKRADQHANQIFLVDGKDRTKISMTTTEGTEWGSTDQWHLVRIDRNCETGEITVWFDDLEQPIMTAVDKTLIGPGMTGFGTFDDTADFSLLRILQSPKESDKAKTPTGNVVEPDKK